MNLFFTCIAVFICVTITSAQIKSTADQLQETYREYVAWQDAGELSYDAELKTMGIKNYRIPVAPTTRVRAEKKEVRFYMQNYTAVTDVNDTTWKRAEFILPFKDKKSALEFVKNFNKLIAEQ